MDLPSYKMVMFHIVALDQRVNDSAMKHGHPLCHAAGHFRVVHFWVGLSDLTADPQTYCWQLEDPSVKKNESIELLVSFY